MRIVVAGLGYLGSTVAACAAADGHDVVGIDPDAGRWSALQAGTSPVPEPGLNALIATGVSSGRLTARPDLSDSCEHADMAIICVATPGTPSGALDFSQISEITESIGLALRSRAPERPALAVVVRSTLTPGTMDGLIVPHLRRSSGAEPGALFEASYNPEFVREASAIDDYRNPSRIVVGERSPGVTRRLLGLYDACDAPLFELSYAAAEIAKLADNSFHALKVTFANELGRLAMAFGLDAKRLSDVFVADRRLNISEAYLRPGGAFGGLCLGKDTQALVHAMKQAGIDGALVGSIVPSNAAHESYLFRAITDHLPGGSEVLVHGIGFKSGSLDLRQSPAIALAEALRHAGHHVRIFDPDVRDPVEFCRQLPAGLDGCWVSNLEDAARRAALVVCWKPVPDGLTSRGKMFDFRSLRLIEPAAT